MTTRLSVRLTPEQRRLYQEGDLVPRYGNRHASAAGTYAVIDPKEPSRVALVLRATKFVEARREIKTAIEYARESTVDAFAVLRACLGSEDERIRLVAALALLDRGWGRVHSTPVNNDGSPIDLRPDERQESQFDVSKLTDEELRALQTVMAARKRLETEE